MNSCSLQLTMLRFRYDDRARVPERQPYQPSQRHARSPPPNVEPFRPGRPAPFARGRSPPPADTYFPNSGRAPRLRSRSVGYSRRRSRSPQFHQRRGSPPPGNAWKGGDRPPQRRWSPRREPVRRDDRPRSPSPRRVRSRSPVAEPRRHSPRGMRQRSPVGVKRTRELSPSINRGLRSPPPAKRERLVSPPRGRFEEPPRRAFSPPRARRHSPAGYRNPNWQQRPQSPLRRDSTFGQQVGGQWKGRSPSPIPHRHRQEHRVEESMGRESRHSSVPPSPAGHPSRIAFQHPTGSDERSRSPPGWRDEEMHGPLQGHAQSAPRSPSERSPYHAEPMLDVERSGRWDRPRSPPRTYSPVPRSPPGRPDYQSMPRHRDYSPPRDENAEYYDNRQQPRYGNAAGPPYRNGYGAGYARGHPGGPSRNMGPSAAMTPPSGPSATPISMSAHNRPGNISVLTAPTHPRGGGGSGPPPRRDSQYSGPNRGRGPPGHYPPPMHSRYPYPPPNMSGSRDRSPNSGGPGVPTGPRSGHGFNHGQGPPPPYRPPPLHSHNSTSRTYPLTQRFSRHISDLPAVVPGGKVLPSNMEKSVSERLAKLQQEQKRLEQELAEKLEKKRAGVRNWDRLERESARDGLKSELAEQQVRMMSGEGGMGGAAF